MEWVRRTQLALVVCAVAMGLCTAGWGKVYYVDDDAVGAGDGSSWGDAFVSPLDALDVAVSGDEIRVAQGIYKPDRGAGFVPPNRDATFALVDGVAFLGGYAGVLAVAPDARDIDRYETILSGDLNGDDGPDFANYAENSRQGVVSAAGLLDARTMIDGFVVTGGSASAGGGIVCVGSRLQVRNCRIVANRALNTGGGMAVEGGSTVVASCTFEGNWAQANGAGLYGQRDRSGSATDSLEIENCSFVGNTAGGNGCGLYVEDLVLTVQSCTFRGNFSTLGTGGRGSQNGSGAGMYADLRYGGTCSDCQFIGNVAEGRGGGVYVSTEALVTVRNCTFEGNSAKDGGGFCSDNNNQGITDLANSMFRANIAQRYGGGVYNVTDAVITGCVFSENTASRGGGLDSRFAYDSASVTHCVFKSNVVQEMDIPAVGGAGVYILPDYGRGHIAPGTLTFKGCRFVGNRAVNVPGGGVYNDGVDLTLVNCLLAGNIAQDGGGVVNMGGSVTARYCTFAQNEAPRIKAVSDNRSESSLDHCIVWGHTDLDLVLASSVAVRYSDIEGGWSTEGSTGNIDVDPLFARPGYWGRDDAGRIVPGKEIWIEGDYHLMSQAGRWDPETEAWVQDEVTSPCIDAGDPKGTIDDEPFPNGGIANVGAYGGSVQASKTYFGIEPAEVHMAGDINGDGEVGLADLLIVILQWTEEETPSDGEGGIRGR